MSATALVSPPRKTAASKLVIVGYNPVTAKIFKGSDEARLIASNTVSYLVEGHENMAGFRSGGWDGRSTFYSWKDDTFPRGFVQLVEAALRGKGYTVQLINRETPAPLGPIKPEIDKFGYVDRYDYQWETVEQLTKRGQMIARVATGGGKSRIAKMAYARIGRPSMFITTRKALMYQMHRSFEASGMPCGIIGDSRWEPHPHLNVAMVPTLATRISGAEVGDKSAGAMRQTRIAEEMREILGKVEFLIGEEAHEAGGDGYFEVLKCFRKAAYRLALTATPFMRADAEDNMRLMAAFGVIGIEVAEKKLIDRGILAKPYFKYHDIEPPKKLRKTTPWQRAYELGITLNEARNNQIVADCKEMTSWGLTNMVLVQRKTHGAILRDLCRAAGLRTIFIFGDTDQAKRDQALAMLGRGEIDVLIGSTILDVGVDVPAVGHICLAGGGKAEVALRQRIGRGLREKKINVAFITDYKDRGNKHLHAHAISRQQVIKDTPGFRENILAADDNFNFEGLGFKRVA